MSLKYIIIIIIIIIIEISMYRWYGMEGQYSVTNCRCDVGLSVRCFHLRSSKIGVRRSMFEDRWSKIDAKIDDRWWKVDG